jgi:hypothetical protein
MGFMIAVRRMQRPSQKSDLVKQARREKDYTVINNTVLRPSISSRVCRMRLSFCRRYSTNEPSFFTFAPEVSSLRSGKSCGSTQHGTTAKGIWCASAASTMASVASSGCSPTIAATLSRKPGRVARACSMVWRTQNRRFFIFPTTAAVHSPPPPPPRQSGTTSSLSSPVWYSTNVASLVCGVWGSSNVGSAGQVPACWLLP